MSEYTDNYVEYTQMSELLTTVKGYVDDHSDGNANLQKVTYEEATALKAHAVGDFIYLNDTVYKVTSAISIGNTITAGTNITATTGLPTDTQIYVDGLPDSGGGGGASVGETHTVTGNPLSFTTDSSQVASNTVVTLEPIQAGSGDPSPSNVRMISGYDSVFIKAIKKNLIDNGAVKQGRNRTDSATNRCASIDVMGVSPGDTVTISGQTSTIKVAIITYLNRGQESVSEDTSSGWITTFPHTYTFTSYGYAWLIYAKVDGTDITPTDVQSAQFQLELGSTATTYEPYNSATDITIPAPDGTIYGGTLDVESGELVVTHAIDSFDGTEAFTLGGSSGGYIYTTNIFTSKSMKTEGPYVSIYGICSHAPNGSGGETISYSYLNAINDNDKRRISFLKTPWLDVVNPFTVENMKTYLAAQKTAGHPVQICYELETPLTYHLSPHQVKLLQGANTVTTNGTSLSLTYRDGEIPSLSDLEGIADSINEVGDLVDTAVKEGESSIIQKINDNIAPTEFTNIASKAYVVGEFFINKDGKLCQVISAIASGATFTLNTNYKEKTIGEELGELNSNKAYMNGTIGTNWFGVSGYNAETGKLSELVINTKDNTMLIIDGVSGHNTLFKLTRI